MSSTSASAMLRLRRMRSSTFSWKRSEMSAAALCQPLHLIRDDREALPASPAPGRLNQGVDGKKPDLPDDQGIVGAVGFKVPADAFRDQPHRARRGSIFCLFRFCCRWVMAVVG